MRLHLVLGVTLLMHSLEVKGGPTADIEGEEKTCKALWKECKDVSECCEEYDDKEGEVVCAKQWESDPFMPKRCLTKKCSPVGPPHECDDVRKCCDPKAQCGDGSGKKPNDKIDYSWTVVYCNIPKN